MPSILAQSIRAAEMAEEDLLSALAWQVDLGADEAIAEHPIDRFAAQEAATSAAGAMPRGPGGSSGAADVARRAQPEMATPRALAEAAPTLDALHQMLAQWDGSELRKGARNCVFADGLPGAHVMIIGEAPGADEDRQGKPFVGRAGQLLDRMLGAIGLDRAAEDPAKAAYIANILPWRPPGNRTPSEQEVALFLPFIERHIALAGPRLLFTIGNTPTKALLATQTGIKRMRGRWRHHPASGLPLLPSFHPAYLLRQPSEKRLSWQDLQALRRALDGETPQIEG
ncbi:MAG: uracil-DNA glycosylase [Pseudomonadota bacterium]